ncbi:extracellular solute-binding protein [Ruminiclostridium cellobioparum]|jgi:raffinose/stachyose/melibiose transport system substrate-binding protein|uniref:extracellular solute-binding protein n=1 Tax=Ruminiclostridium cellobioparum TaxID=29355 RepID=UPI000481D9A5|nr:extracellular solute-binding protein [Ruminiclostridium cellobioparum]
MNKMLVKRGMAFILAGALAVGMTACGKPAGDNTGTATNTNAGNTNAGAGKQVELKFSHIWGGATDPFMPAAKKVIDDYQKANKNVRITVDTNENEAYKTKIKAMAAANELPDLFSTWGGGFSKPFIDSNSVLAIDDYITAETKGKLVNGAFNNLTYNDKIYGMPFFLAAGALFVNTELFDKNNVKLPATYDELLTAIKAFKAKGITPMAVSGKDKWTIAMYFDVMALRAAGPEKIVKTLTKEGSFKDPEFLNAAKRFKELVDAGAFSKGAAGISNDEAEVPFYDGKIPMMFKGSWAAGKADAKDSKVAGKIGVISFPAIPDGKGNAKQFTGGAVDAVMVSANTKNKDEAVKFQMYFAENFSKESYLAGAAMPAWKAEDVDKSKLPATLVKVVDLTKDAEGFTIWWDTLLAGKDTETYLNALQELFMGAKTPEQFVDSLQSIYGK